MKVNTSSALRDREEQIRQRNQVPLAEVGDGAEVRRVSGNDHHELIAGAGGREPAAFVVRRMALEFLRPARIDEVLEVETRVKEIGAAHLVLDQRVTEIGDLLPLAGVEHVMGAESKAETGELHALDTADPMDQQAITWCLAADYLPGEDHTIERPADYERFRKIEGDAMFPIAMHAAHTPAPCSPN